MNTVSATGLSGIYVDKEINIKIGKTYEDTVIKVNNKIVKNCIGAWIKMVMNKPTKVYLEFDALYYKNLMRK